MKKTILLLITISILSCNLERHLDKITIEINKISDLYQTEVTYKITKKIKFNVKQDMLLVKVTINDALKRKYNDKYYIPASNIAYLLFKDLPEQKYDKYIVEFYEGHNKIMKKIYERKNLEKLMKKLSVFDKLNSLLKNRDYEKVYELFDKEHLNLSKKEFIDMFNQFNTITDIKYEGFLYGKLTVKNKNIPYIASFETICYKDGILPVYIIMDETKNKFISFQNNWN